MPCSAGGMLDIDLCKVPIKYIYNRNKDIFTYMWAGNLNTQFCIRNLFSLHQLYPSFK